jgi:hypothetical protein
MSDQEWELSSGLPLDGATVTVTAAEFGYRQNIAKDTTFACLTFKPVEGDEAEQCYSVGKGWEPGARGAELVTSDGRKRNINDQTGYGKFITAALKCDGMKETLRDRGIHYTKAAAWEGLRFELASVKEEVVNPTTGQKKETSRILPVKFLGVAGDEKTTTTATGGNGGNGGNGGTGLEPALEAKLLALASSSDSHDSFMAAAFAQDGVAGSAAEDLVMASGKGSIWARGQAIQG